jgi:hypothetical protein
LPDASIDWTDVVERALRHGVGGLLCRSIGTLPSDLVPPDIAAAARVFLDEAHREGATRVAELAAVLDALAAGDVPALAFKGPALGALAHDSPTIRPSRDLDVLVRTEDMQRAIDALGRLGYRPSDVLSAKATAACFVSYGQDIVFAEGRAPVEPHCAFVPSTLAVDLDMRGIWQRARPVRVGDGVAQTLSLEDTLLAACLHGGKERWWRLLWIADIAALIHRHRDLDWTAVDERARAAGVRRMLLLGLGLARDVFDSAVPTTLANSIDGNRVVQRLLGEVMRDLSQAQALGPPERLSMYSIRLRERPLDRLRHVVRALTTPRVHHYTMLRLPDALFGGYVAVKVVHDYVLLPLWWLAKGRSRRRPVG